MAQHTKSTSKIMNITMKHWADGLINNPASDMDNTAALSASPVSMKTGDTLRICVQTMDACLG